MSEFTSLTFMTDKKNSPNMFFKREEYLDDTDFEVYQEIKVLKLIHHTILHEQKSNSYVSTYL